MNLQAQTKHLEQLFAFAIKEHNPSYAFSGKSQDLAKVGLEDGFEDKNLRTLVAFLIHTHQLPHSELRWLAQTFANQDEAFFLTQGGNQALTDVDLEAMLFLEYLAISSDGVFSDEDVTKLKQFYLTLRHDSELSLEVCEAFLTLGRYGIYAASVLRPVLGTYTPDHDETTPEYNALLYILTRLSNYHDYSVDVLKDQNAYIFTHENELEQMTHRIFSNDSLGVNKLLERMPKRTTPPIIEINTRCYQGQQPNKIHGMDVSYYAGPRPHNPYKKGPLGNHFVDIHAHSALARGAKVLAFPKRRA